METLASWNDVRLRSGAFSDPQGSGTFAAMRWRVAEVTRQLVAGRAAAQAIPVA